MEVLVIDEVSMVRADLLDNIDWFLRINRDIPLPFGGLQVVFFGDLFQLPPVVRTTWIPCVSNQNMNPLFLLRTRHAGRWF